MLTLNLKVFWAALAGISKSKIITFHTIKIVFQKDKVVKEK